MVRDIAVLAQGFPELPDVALERSPIFPGMAHGFPELPDLALEVPLFPDALVVIRAILANADSTFLSLDPVLGWAGRRRAES